MQRLPLIAVLAAAFVLFSVNIGGYNLWPPDEPRFGEIAREMMQSHNPIALTINGEPYREKPPLLFWLIALVSLPFGDVTEVSARAPSVVAALVTVYFTLRLASRMYGQRVGLCAGMVLMTSGLFWWEARSVRTDMLLTACLTAALYAFWMHHETKSRNWAIAFYAAIGAAVFAKGPPGIVFPLLLVFTFYWRRREERRALHLVWGLVAVAAAVSIWIVPAYMTGAAAHHAEAHELSLGGNLFRQTIGRFFLGVSKANPPWYYLENIPLIFFPWTLFLPWVLWFVWKARHEGAAMRLLLSWIVPALLFFSICSGKRSVYVLPLFPAAAILTGYALVALSDAPKYTWMRRGAGIAWTVLLLAVGISFPYFAYGGWIARDAAATLIASAFLHNRGVTIGVDVLRALSVLTLVALAFSIHACWSAFRRSGRAIHFAVAGHFAGLAVVCALLIMPQADTFKGASVFCAPLRHLSEAGLEYKLYSVAFSREEYIFYSKHKHTAFLVYDWPMKPPPNMDRLEFVNRQRALGNALRKATDTVPIADWAHISDAEVAALSAKADGVYAFAKAKSPLVGTFKSAVGAAVQQFAEHVMEAGPTFIIVQEGDWRWLVTFAPGLRNLTLLNRTAVGSDRVLLLANAAGAKLLSRAAD